MWFCGDVFISSFIILTNPVKIDRVDRAHWRIARFCRYRPISFLLFDHSCCGYLFEHPSLVPKKRAICSKNSDYSIKLLILCSCSFILGQSDQSSCMLMICIYYCHSKLNCAGLKHFTSVEKKNMACSTIGVMRISFY